VHIGRDKPVRTCSKFRHYPSFLIQPHHVTSSIGADVFWTFVNAIDGISPTITSENVTDIELLCEEFGYEKPLATVSELAAQQYSPGERACHKIAALKSQNAALAVQVAQLKETIRQMAARMRS
jgi:hypothetical protein